MLGDQRNCVVKVMEVPDIRVHLQHIMQCNLVVSVYCCLGFILHRTEVQSIIIEDAHVTHSLEKSVCAIIPLYY